MSGARLAVALMVACGPAPSLSVEVDHPDAARIEDAIRETTVSIYESDGLTCEQVELGDLSTEQLEALISARVVIVKGGATSGTFDGVSRLAHKVIVARGLGEKGALLTAACAELDEVGEGELVKLATVVAAKVSIAPAEDTYKGILVTTTEPLPGSLSINQRAVSWRVYGPSGTAIDSALIDNVASGVWEPKAPTCTRGGEATIHPIPPKVPGGYAVRLRVSWATEPPPLITLFTELPHVPRDLTTPLGIVRPCAVRRSGGTAGVVCITAPQLATELRLSGGALVPAATAPLTFNTDPVIGVVSIELRDEADTRHVYAITEHGNWQPLFGAPPNGIEANRNWWCGVQACGTLTTYDLQIMPPCAGGIPGRLAAKVGPSPTQTTLRTMPWYGGAQEPVPMGGDSIASAGCLTERQLDGNPRQRQAIVVTSPVGSTAGFPAGVIFDCLATRNPCMIQLTSDGVGFVPELPPRMIVGSFDASGSVLSSVDARPNEVTDSAGKTRDRLIEVSRQPAAAPPDQLITGHFDNDGVLDLLWHFSTRSTGASIQVAYAREVDGTPLTAIAQYVIGASIDELLSGDLDGNGVDDIIAVLGPNARKLDVIPMGVPYPPPPINADPACP